MRHLLPLLALACTTAPTDGPDTGDTAAVGTTCADDTTLTTPQGPVSCVDAGQLCDPELAACVDPWAYGSPTFEACTDDPDLTEASLAAKAATYEDRAVTLHVHPDLNWMMGVRLDADADPGTATFDDVDQWLPGENDGLWSSLYLASQAFRYGATTGEEQAEALAMVKRLLDGEQERMGVSGVRGNFVRTYRKPGVDGMPCPTDDEAYRADVEKDDNRWVKVNDDGCITHLPMDGGDDWVVSDACPGTDYAGWCFFDNTSKDEYSGHFFALGAVLKLVDDADAQAVATQLLADAVDEIVENDLEMTDHDGRRTEHGDFSPLLGGGFNAALILGAITALEHGTDLERFATYKRCLTSWERGPECPDIDPNPAERFQDYLPINGVHLDPNGCVSNDNVASMFLLGLVNLIWWETDPELKATYQATLRDIWEADGFLRALGNRENAWYDVIWAAFKPLGAGTDGPATAYVHEAACGLGTFPADQVRREVPPFDAEQICLDRLDRPMGAVPRGAHERCLEAFVWWKDQYVLRGCSAEPTVVEPPADYLLPYWMGRYFGMFDPSW